MPRRRPRRLSLSEDEGEDDDSGKERPQQRNAANARERARMRVLSRAFCRLKTTLPWVPPDTKLSKLDTLRLATSYIAHLRAVLCLEDEDDDNVKNTVHPLNLTWPFSFQQPGTPSNPPHRPPWELSPPPTRPSKGETEPMDSSATYPAVAYPHGYSDPLMQMG